MCWRVRVSVLEGWTASALQSSFPNHCKLGRGETNDISFDMLILQLCIQTI
jgi:hypothetical protein